MIFYLFPQYNEPTGDFLKKPCLFYINKKRVQKGKYT